MVFKAQSISGIFIDVDAWSNSKEGGVRGLGWGGGALPTLAAYQVTPQLLQVLGLNAAAFAAFKVDYYLRSLFLFKMGTRINSILSITTIAKELGWVGMTLVSLSINMK